MKSVRVLKFLSILLLLLSAVLLVINPQKENNLEDGYLTPIVAFEFIKTKDAVVKFFQVKEPYTYKSKMLLGNAIDYAFMAVYSSLLMGISLVFKQKTSSRIFSIAVVLCLLMWIGDALENLQIYHIIQTYAASEIDTHLYLLNIFTWLKWASIVSVFGLFSVYYFRQNGVLTIINGIFGIICLMLAVVAFFAQSGIMYEVFALSVILNFLLTTIYIFVLKDNTTKAQNTDQQSSHQ